MGRRFMTCPNCNKLTLARRKGNKYFCLRCHKEIPEPNNNSSSISTPQPDNFTMIRDHTSYPEISRTGGLK